MPKMNINVQNFIKMVFVTHVWIQKYTKINNIITLINVIKVNDT